MKTLSLRMCRHCNRRPGKYPRRLCWTCYSTPAVKALYPVSKYAGDPDRPPNFSGAAKPPKRPTSKLPGTPAHFAVLARRAVRGEQLRHPDDAVADPERAGGQERGICRLLVAIGVELS